MPYTPAQRRLFAACKHNPEKVNAKCPSKSDATKMLKHGVKYSPSKRRYKRKA